MSEPPITKAEREVEPVPIGKSAVKVHGERLADPTAVVLASDIVRWIVPTVGKFPRNVRYGLGARVETALIDVLEQLVVAQYARGGLREAALERANLRLQTGRHLARIAFEMKLVSERQWVYLAKNLYDLGNQVGAWRKASGATANSSANSATPRT